MEEIEHKVELTLEEKRKAVKAFMLIASTCRNLSLGQFLSCISHWKAEGEKEAAWIE